VRGALLPALPVTALAAAPSTAPGLAVAPAPVPTPRAGSPNSTGGQP
jgi:hypothetical protein